MIDEDQVGTPLTRRAPTWFMIGCVALIVLVVSGALVLWLRLG